MRLSSHRIHGDDGERLFLFVGQNYDVGAVQSRFFEQTLVDESFTNVVIGVDTFFITGENYGCGIAFRYQDDNNQSGYNNSSKTGWNSTHAKPITKLL